MVWYMFPNLHSSLIYMLIPKLNDQVVYRKSFHNLQIIFHVLKGEVSELLISLVAGNFMHNKMSTYGVSHAVSFLVFDEQ